MNIFKMALISLGKKALTLILIILELTALFAGEIYTVNIIEERSMLSKTFNELLEQENCYFVYDSKFIEKKILNPKLTSTQSKKDLLENIKSNYQIYDAMSAIVGSYYVISLSDEIYRRLALPLMFGSLGSGENSAVASLGVGRGDFTVEGDKVSIDLNICGTLTNETFMPVMTSFDGNNMTTKNLFSPINADNIIITGRSAIKGFEDQFTSDTGFFILFDSNAKEDVNFLKKSANVPETKIIKENSRKALQEDLSGFIPLLGCFVLIVLIGIVCVSLTMFNENKYKNGVLWLCGYSKAKILLIQAVGLTIMPAVSFVLSVIALYILKAIFAEVLAGLTITLSCIVCVLITVILFLGISMAAPIIKTAGKSPVEYLGRAK